MDTRFRTYASRLLSQYRQSLRAGQISMAVATAALALVSWILGWAFLKFDQSIFYVGCVAIAFVHFLFVAPFRLWQKSSIEIASLKESMRPKLAFTRLVATKKGEYDYDYGIEIQNTGTQHLGECLVKIESIDVTDGQATGHRLPVVIRTLTQIEGNRHGSFNLRAGECKILKLVHQIASPSRYMGVDHESGGMWLTEIRRCVFRIGAYGSPSPATGEVEAWLESAQRDRLVARLKS